MKVPAKVYSFGKFIPVTIKNSVDSAYQALEKKEYDQGLSILLPTLKINYSPNANQMIGMIYPEKNYFINAEEYLNYDNTWFKFEPDFVVLMFQIELNIQKFVEAGKCLEQLQQIDPNNRGLPVFRKMLIDSMRK